jgi:type IV pilus assembly protein PilV
MPEVANAMTHAPRSAQGGIVLVEALVAALLFIVGVLGMVGALSQSVAYEADAEFRNQATKVASEMMNTIWLSVDRTTATTASTTLAAFSHQASTDGNCAFSGAVSGNSLVTDWTHKIVDGVAGDVTARLPGATEAMQQIVVDTANNNEVTIRLCWQSPKDPAPRQYVLRAYVN